MLEVRELSAGYAGVQVLWDVELDVGDQEIVALVGSNGAGKTTLLRAISALLHPLAGSVRWRGRETVGMRPEHVVRLGIAHVPKGRRLFAGLTVRENLEMGAYQRRDARVREDIEWVLELFPHLRQHLERIAGRLSGGEQQMCAIARGLMSLPKLLMIDELSLGLAPNLVESLLARLSQIVQRGTSVLLVEQDVDAALTIATSGYVLETGRIVAHGPGKQLRADPRIREAYLGVA